jgi:hypothetical protein
VLWGDTDGAVVRDGEDGERGSSLIIFSVFFLRSVLRGGVRISRLGCGRGRFLNASRAEQAVSDACCPVPHLVYEFEEISLP